MRRQTWALLEEWDRRLEAAGIETFADVIRRARDIARTRSRPTYRAAIIDESQDLTLAGLQLIRALVNGPSAEDRPNGLFIVGDAAQKIYPGGFTLLQAGVDVRGNSAILRINYRNAAPILSAAMACAGAEPVNDDGDSAARSDSTPETLREGPPPQYISGLGFDAQIERVAKEARRLAASSRMDIGDMAVFTPAKRDVEQVGKGLCSAGLPWEKLDAFEGVHTEAIKVGTLHRAKGLEFKVVFLVFSRPFPRWSYGGEPREQYREERGLQISQLFVAMTRARDALYIFCNREGDVMRAARDRFERGAITGRFPPSPEPGLPVSTRRGAREGSREA